MELGIQKWVRKTKPFMKESEELFNEAVECYKAGANRAAFIMSYLAYEKELQLRILNFKDIPNEVKETDWEKTKEDLLIDKKWETAVFLSIQNGIIKLSDQSDVIKRLGAYKVLRNTCVHGKSQTINSATVEEFWNFLKDNIFRFNINGGKEYFKESLFKSFRDRNELLDLTYYNLLESLPFSNLSEDELIDIWNYINLKINDLYGVSELDIKQFWDEILFNKDEKIQQSFIKFTEQNCNQFMKFYKINNSLLDLSISISDGIIFKKEILYEWIKCGEPSIYGNECFWEFIIKILNYIPKEDISGFFKLLDIKDIVYVPSEEQCDLLKNYDFFDVMKDYLFCELKYDYDEISNRLRYIDIILFITKNSLDEDILLLTANYWNRLTYYSKYPQTRELRNILEEELLMDKKFTDNVVDIFNKMNNNSKYSTIGSMSNIKDMIDRSNLLNF